MSSLKQVQRDYAQRKQVYKPILENPYTNEAHVWPHIAEQPLVAELVRRHVISPLAHAQEMGLKAPLEVRTGFNSVVEYLEAPPSDEPVFLFVCNRDATPAVVLAQIPTLAHVSSCHVTLVALPRGSIISFNQCFSDHDGLLLVVENAGFDHQFAARLRQCVDEPAPQPWLQFAHSRLGVLKSSVPLAPKRGTIANSHSTGN